MKTLLCFFAVVVIFSAQVKAQTPAPPGDPGWQIDETTYLNMKNRGCSLFKPCHGTGQVKNYNKEEYDWIKSYYNIGDDAIVPVAVRYTDDDEDRYKLTRGLDASPDAYTVRGYKTIVYMVTVPSMSKGGSTGSITSTTYYYDIVTICPPPYDSTCN